MSMLPMAWVTKSLSNPKSACGGRSAGRVAAAGVPPKEDLSVRPAKWKHFAVDIHTFVGLDRKNYE
jgi:hypothetical protein